MNFRSQNSSSLTAKKWLLFPAMLLVLFALVLFPDPIQSESFPSTSFFKTPAIFFGRASWYGHPFHGRTTANGETYNMNKLTAAHKTLPLGTYVEVTNLRNQKTVIVKINDRGPYIWGRSLDLSFAAAQELDCVETGVVKVSYRILQQKSHNHQFASL